MSAFIWGVDYPFQPCTSFLPALYLEHKWPGAHEPGYTGIGKSGFTVIN